MNICSIPFNGKYKIFKRYGEGNEIFMSASLENPTFRDILMEIDKLIEITGDYHHTFLEDIYIGHQIDDEIYSLNVMLGS